MSSSSWLRPKLSPKYSSKSSLPLLNQNVHSCSHCQFTIDPPADGGSFQQAIIFSKKQAEKGISAGCAFIKWCVAEAVEVGGKPPLQFDIDFLVREGSKYDIVEAEFKFHNRFGPSLTVCTDSDDPAAQYISTRPINPDPASDASCALALQWAEDCHANHPECQVFNEGFAPLRLIDVGSEGDRAPKLYKPHPQERLQWCCLSSCWGGDQLIRTTKSMRDAFGKSIPSSLLPRTVQDAIRTTRALGVPYLWVDALCITQDDDDEVTSQIAAMSKIYKGAYVTIVASVAQKSSDGFLQRRDLDESDQPMFALPYRSPSGKTGSLYFFMDNGYDPRDEPVRRRAWTLQERLLSVRILEYGKRHMRWACSTKRYGDGGHRNPIPFGAEAAERSERLLKSYKQGGGDRPVVLWSWHDLVANYTSRVLSVPGDKLPAISGIAREYAESLQATYYAGFFEDALPANLVWKVVASTQRMRPSVYRAPSFSWAAVDSPVTWLLDRPDTFLVMPSNESKAEPAAEVLEKHVKLAKSDDLYGTISDCVLRLRAPVVKDHLVGHSEFHGTATMTILGRTATLDAIDETYLRLLQAETVAVYVIGLVRHKGVWYCLVAASDDGVHFRSLGSVAQDWRFRKSLDPGWNWQEVCLV